MIRNWISFAIGGLPKHLPRHCDARWDKFWKQNHHAVTLTIFEGSGHWMLTIGPILIKSYPLKVAHPND